MNIDLKSGVLVGSSVVSIGEIATGWEVRRNGEGLQTFSDERVARARAVKLIQALQPDDRPTCLVCARQVGAIKGKFAPHNSELPAPGREPRACPGSGLRLAP